MRRWLCAARTCCLVTLPPNLLCPGDKCLDRKAVHHFAPLQSHTALRGPSNIFSVIIRQG